MHGNDDRKHTLAEKYRAERAKRLNPQGNEQYIASEGAFAQFAFATAYGGGPTEYGQLLEKVAIRRNGEGSRVRLSGSWSGPGGPPNSTEGCLR